MRTNRPVGAVTALGALVLTLSGGCDLVANIGEYCVEGVDPGCGTGGAGGATTTSMGGGGTTTTSMGGGGTTTSTAGGGGTGGEQGCTPPATQECYTGPTGTKDVGICSAGAQTCLPEGTWGPCEGEQAPMLEDCALEADEDCNFGTGCSETVWGKVFGDASVQRVNDIAFDAAGNLYAVGTFSGTLDFSGGQLIAASDDVFVVKLDSSGNHVWSRRYGDAADQSATAVTVDSGGGVLVVGVFEGGMQVGDVPLASAGGADVFVFKLNADGEKVWARSFGDAGLSQTGQDVAVDGQDNVILVGSFDGELDFDGKKAVAMGGKDAFLAKLSAQGTGIWASRFGDTSNQYCAKLSVDSVGNISIAGEFDGAMNFGSGNSVTATGGSDVYVARFDSGGTSLWAKKIDSASNARPNGLAADAAGDVVVSLESNGNTDAGGGTLLVSTYDIVLAKFSSGGVFQWQKQLGGTGDEYAPRMAVDPQKRPVVAFYTDGPVSIDGVDLPPGGGYDIVVAALEPSGDLRWAKRYGLISDQTSPVVAVGPKGQIGLGCLASGDIDFGAGAITTMGSDVALAVIGPN